MTNFMDKTENYMEENKVQVQRLTETVSRSEPRTPRFPLLPAPNSAAKKRRIEKSQSVFQQPAAAALPVDQTGVQQYSSVVAGVSALSGQQQEQIRSLQQLQNNQQKKQQQQPARQRNICYGTAKPTSNSSNQDMLAADVSLVASSLDKECDEHKLKVFLEERGIHPVDIVMMKKQDVNETETKNWRTKSFKVTVKAGEHETALKPETWPYRVAVRYWRAERRPRTGGWDSQARTSGGQFSGGGQSGGGRQSNGGQFGGGGQYGTGQLGGQQQKQGRSRQDSQGWQQQQPRGRGSAGSGQQQQQEVMEVSNMFANLDQVSVSAVVESSA